MKLKIHRDNKTDTFIVNVNVIEDLINPKENNIVIYEENKSIEVTLDSKLITFLQDQQIPDIVNNNIVLECENELEAVMLFIYEPKIKDSLVQWINQNKKPFDKQRQIKADEDAYAQWGITGLALMGGAFAVIIVGGPLALPIGGTLAATAVICLSTAYFLQTFPAKPKEIPKVSKAPQTLYYDPPVKQKRSPDIPKEDNDINLDDIKKYLGS